MMLWRSFAAAADLRVAFTQFAFGVYQNSDPSFQVTIIYNGTAADADAAFAATGLSSYLSPVSCVQGGVNPVNPGGPLLPFPCSNIRYQDIHELIGYCGFETNRAFKAASLYEDGPPLTLAGAQAMWTAFASIHTVYGCVAEWSDIYFDGETFYRLDVQSVFP